MLSSHASLSRKNSKLPAKAGRAPIGAPHRNSSSSSSSSSRQGQQDNRRWPKAVAVAAVMLAASDGRLQRQNTGLSAAVCTVLADKHEGAVREKTTLKYSYNQMRFFHQQQQQLVQAQPASQLGVAQDEVVFGQHQAVVYWGHQPPSSPQPAASVAAPGHDSQLVAGSGAHAAGISRAAATAAAAAAAATATNLFRWSSPGECSQPAVGQYDRSSRSCSLKRSCPAPGRLGVRLALGSLVAQQFLQQRPRGARRRRRVRKEQHGHEASAAAAAAGSRVTKGAARAAAAAGSRVKKGAARAAAAAGGEAVTAAAAAAGEASPLLTSF
ncbi:hypothetical protein N2152v2_002926 [Parachlorella kessleri]